MNQSNKTYLVQAQGAADAAVTAAQAAVTAAESALASLALSKEIGSPTTAAELVGELSRLAAAVADAEAVETRAQAVADALAAAVVTFDAAFTP